MASLIFLRRSTNNVTFVLARVTLVSVRHARPWSFANRGRIWPFKGVAAQEKLSDMSFVCYWPPLRAHRVPAGANVPIETIYE